MRDIDLNAAMWAAEVVAGNMLPAGVPEGPGGVVVLATFVSDAPAPLQPFMCRAEGRYFVRHFDLAPGTGRRCPARATWLDMVGTCRESTRDVDGLRKLFDRESVAASLEIRHGFRLVHGWPTHLLVELADPRRPAQEAALVGLIGQFPKRVPGLSQLRKAILALDKQNASLTRSTL